MLPACKSSTYRRRTAGVITLLLAFALSASLAGPASASAARPIESDVTFVNGATTLHGTVIAPAGSASGRPGVVMVAGAGPRHRDEHRREAEALARAGIVALIYDKRQGYSRATSSFADLADDAVAGVEHLRARTDVDPRAVGLWGHSEGGWVAPYAASRSTAVGFVVVAAASGLPADRTQVWSNRTQLAVAGVSPALYGPLGVSLPRMLVDADLFGDVDHDPVATLQRVRQPVLGVFADHDLSTPPGESVDVYREALRAGGNPHYTLAVLDGTNHRMQPSEDGAVDRSPSGAPAPGYLDLVTSWVNGLGAQPPGPRADPPPDQLLASTPLAPLAWYEIAPVQLTVLLVVLVTFLSYPVGAMVELLRGRRGSGRDAWPARLLAGAGTATVLGTSTYLFVLVATGTTRHGPVLLGRPLVWLVLQMLAVVVVTATVVVALRWWRTRTGGTDRVRRAALLVGGVLFAPWAIYWGLFAI